jgi:small redox-active disulfide protein 2
MKIDIKVLGGGCTKCNTLKQITTEVVAENNYDADIQKIEDITQILNYHVMATPALVINGKAVSSGRLPTKAEIKDFIDQAIG